MTHLNIQQGLNVEIVNTLIIKRLYNAAQSVPLPEEGEQDLANMSGNLQVDKSYRSLVEYLTTRFPDLHINVTDSYYIPFEDSNVQSVLMANNISSDGIGITEADASTANLGTIFKDNTTITSFDEFGYFTKANTSPSANMFRDCTNLEEIDLSDVTTIADHLFFKTAITDVNVPNLTLMSGSALFSDCHQLETVTNLGHVSNIPGSCFSDCENLQSAVLPDECSTLVYHAFFIGLTYWLYGGSLQTVSGINHVSRFGEGCFLRQFQLRLSASDLQSAVVIEKGAFLYVPVSSINCPSLTSLAQDAFRENKALTSIECLGKISSISSYCFDKDNALQTVKIPYECTSITDNAFNGCSSLTSITQYNKSLDDYAEGESPTFTNISRITSFGNNCFYNCGLLSLTASDLSSAVSIGSSAFEKCSAININTLDLSNVGTIGDDAFRNGPHIDNVVWSNSQTTLPTGVFGKAVLKSIINIEHVTKIYGRTLLGCQLNHVLYLKNVDTTCYYGTNTSGGDNGNTFTADNKNGSAYALYMPKTKDLYGGYHSNNTYSSGFFGGRGTTTIPVVYFKDLEEIYPSSFGSLTCTSLIINNVTPPVWYNTLKKTDEQTTDDSNKKKHVFPGDCHITYIYVPDSALTTYTSDADWSTLVAKGVTFKSMNELTHYTSEADWVAAGKPATGIIEEYM